MIILQFEKYYFILKLLIITVAYQVELRIIFRVKQYITAFKLEIIIKCFCVGT